MKRITIYLMVAGVVGVLFLTTAVFGLTGEDLNANLVQNSGFEEDIDADGIADAWFLFNGQVTDNMGMVYVTYREVFRTGKASALFFSVRKVANDGIAQDVKVEPGKTYCFRAWLRVSNMKSFSQESPARIMLIFLDAQGKGIGKPLSMDVWLKKDNTWEEAVKEFRVPEDVSHLRLWLFMSQSTGWVWFDDIELREVAKNN